VLKFRLWFGAFFARLTRALRRRNILTISGAVWGLLNITTAIIIVFVPMFLESDKLLEASKLPSRGIVLGWSWHINVAIIITIAYGYQFLFKTIENARSQSARQPHQLKRNKVESRAINRIHDDLRNNLQTTGALAADGRLLQAVLEAALLTVAEEVGGYAEMEKLEANLIIRSPNNPDNLRVIARFGNTRQCPIEYTMDQRSFCAALWRGDPTAAVAGNIAAIAPDSGRDVPYKDILRLPVLDSSGNIAAALSIDSTEKYHFPRRQTAIQRLEFEVSPHLALLRMILEL